MHATRSFPLRTTIALLATLGPACAALPESGLARALLLDPGHAEWSQPAPPTARARFETSKGPIVLELVREWAPLGVDRFYNLVRLGFYDDARFHRVSNGYIVQFGLSGDPAVTAAWRGHELPDDPPRSRNRRGTFAFAMKGPSTRLTQVYINLADNSRNDDEAFSILGTVVEGMAVLDSLYSGYGESSGSGMRQGRQSPIEEGGNAYLDRQYPLLDRILRACIIAPVNTCQTKRTPDGRTRRVPNRGRPGTTRAPRRNASARARPLSRSHRSSAPGTVHPPR
jgi:cyclophilin family peptidyl-prolyl cis-trans isomerase